LQLKKIAETGTTVTVGWDPVPGCEGYLFYKDGVRVSRTFDPKRKSVKFSKPYQKLRVEAVVFTVVQADDYPDSAPTFIRVAPRVAYADGGSDARYCTVNQPGVTRGADGHAIDERGATYDPNGLCENGLRSDGSAADCPTGARNIDGREICSLPTQGDPHLNTGSWLI
jgi:hypothetical protein